jgi:multidrug efflux pump subunit AcrA (membrane-fusion protein)
MQKRKSILLGIFVLVVTIGISVMFAAMKEPPKRKATAKKELMVPVRRIQNEKVPLVVSVVGSLEAHEKVEVFAEVNGVLEKSNRPFLEGVNFQKGEVLLRIKDDKYRASLYSKKSSLMNEIAKLLPDLKFDFPNSYEDWKNYLTEFSIESGLHPLPEPKDEKEKYFVAGRNIYQTYYDIKSMEEELQKYTLRAPFTGEISESNIKPGTLVRSGQKLGEFLNTSSYNLIVGVDLNSLRGIEKGAKVELSSDNLKGNWIGIVDRISSRVDDKTQMVDVYITVSGKDLKEGMFLCAAIQLKEEAYGVEIARKLLLDTNKVLIVKNGLIEEAQVNIVQYRNNTVVVEGLPENSLLSLKTSGVHKGLKVSPIEQ